MDTLTASPTTAIPIRACLIGLSTLFSQNFRVRNLSPIWDLPILDTVGIRPCGECAVTVRQVDLNYWRVYDIPLVAGRLFSTEEFDACRDVVVIGEQLAREAFGSAEAAIGKNYFVNFRPKRIVGVTKDVSSLFTFAYGELWMPYSTRDSGLGSEGLRGDFEAVALVRPGVGREELKRQIEQSLARFNEH